MDGIGIGNPIVNFTWDGMGLGSKHAVLVGNGSPKENLHGIGMGPGLNYTGLGGTGTETLSRAGL